MAAAEEFQGPRIFKVESRRMSELDPGVYFEWHPLTGGVVYVIRPVQQKTGVAARAWKIGTCTTPMAAKEIIAAYAVGFAQAQNGPESEPEA